MPPVRQGLFPAPKALPAVLQPPGQPEVRGLPNEGGDSGGQEPDEESYGL